MWLDGILRGKVVFTREAFGCFPLAKEKTCIHPQMHLYVTQFFVTQFSVSV